MTDASYRIELRPDPHSTSWPFSAYVTRLSDDTLVTIIPGDTAADAETKGREWIVRENNRPSSSTLYVGDDGQDAEIPL